MDWSKAKNVLIIAFIITNIFLLYNMGKDVFKKEDLQLISDQYIQLVEDYLKENGVELKIDIPKEIVSLPVLMVKYKVFEPEETARKFLGDDYDRLNDNTFRTDSKIIEIVSEKKLVYKNFSKDFFRYGMNEKEIIQLSQQFLKEYGFFNDGLQLQQIYYGVNEEFDQAPLYKLVYNQTYKNRFLGESYINIYVNQRGVIGLEAMLLEYEKTFPSKKRTIPATEALLRAMSEMLEDNEGKVYVKKIEMGYYFNPYNIQLTDWQTVESGTAFPTWKITLNNGKMYYIEALKN